MNALPLAGRRVLVTRAARQAGKLSDGLRELGAEPVEVAVLEIQPPASYEPLDTAVKNLNDYDWLFLTSANAVDALKDRAAALTITLGKARPRVAAVGEVTARLARAAGLNVELIPESYVAESLIEAIGDRARNKRVLLARATVARDVIPDALRRSGAVVDIVDVYRNVLPESAPGLLREAIASRLDAATFTSSSSVTHLVEAASLAGIQWPLADIPAVSIGPITSKTLRDSHWEPAAEAAQSDIPGLIAALQQFFAR